MRKTRDNLLKHLQARLPEIEQAMLARLQGLSASSPTSSKSGYTASYRASISIALSYVFNAIEQGEQNAPPIPVALLEQARAAARNRIPLELLLRHYIAGHTLLGDFLLREAKKNKYLKLSDTGPLLHNLTVLLDHLLMAISDAHSQEIARWEQSSEQRRTDWIRRLLKGEVFDTSEIDYDFDANHIAAIAIGRGAEEAVRNLATALDFRLLMATHHDKVSAWLGTRREIQLSELKCAISNWEIGVHVATGAPANGLLGWRRTYEQASMALAVAMRGSEVHVSYTDVALLAAVIQNGLLSNSLREIFLDPLDDHGRKNSAALRKTLRAYFSAERNVSSTAAALGVSRQTVSNRLRVIEQLIDRPLSTCIAELDIALRVEEIGISPKRAPMTS